MNRDSNYKTWTKKFPTVVYTVFLELNQFVCWQNFIRRNIVHLIIHIIFLKKTNVKLLFNISYFFFLNFHVYLLCFFCLSSKYSFIRRNIVHLIIFNILKKTVIFTLQIQATFFCIFYRFYFQFFPFFCLCLKPGLW